MQREEALTGRLPLTKILSERGSLYSNPDLNTPLGISTCGTPSFLEYQKKDNNRESYRDAPEPEKFLEEREAVVLTPLSSIVTP